MVTKMVVEDREALWMAAKRFVLLSSAGFTALLGSLWITSVVSPALIGELTGFNLAYVVTTSAIVALTFAGLYSAASVLRRRKGQDVPA